MMNDIGVGTAVILGVQLLQTLGIFTIIFKAGMFFRSVTDLDRRVTQIEERDRTTEIAVLENRIVHIEGASRCPAIHRSAEAAGAD